MLQEVFRIPYFNIPIYGYGLMLVLAFLACVQTAKMMSRRVGLDSEFFINAALIAMFTGVVGARLSHVLENIHTYTNPERGFWDNVLDAVNIRSGGLTFYGGFILATPCCIAYAIHCKLPLKKAIDIVAPLVMIGLGIGRIGCYLNGCCYGEICKPVFAASWTEFPYYSNAYVDQYERGLIQVPDALIAHDANGRIKLDAGHWPMLKNWDEIKKEDAEKHNGLIDLANQQKALPVQPTQLYSTVTALLLAGLLIAFWTTRHADGQVFALMMMLEGPSRFILEMLRVEPVVLHKIGPFVVDWSLSMVLGVLVFVAGIVLWVLMSRSSETRLPRGAARVAA